SPKIVTENDKTLSKTIVFVIDHSGSMSGEKINQVRESLKFGLNTLKPGDTFNIVSYNDRVESFKPEIQEFNDENRKQAISFCDSLRASGSTNIGAAFSTALGMLQDKKQPSYIVFLTDGLPTSGEMDEMRLANIAKDNNKVNARIFCFGVGFDVNARLLDRLARDGNGMSEFVLPNENIEGRISSLCNRISSPILADAEFEIKSRYHSDTISHLTNLVYPSGKFDLFAGQQLVIVGRYSKPCEIEIKLKGKVGETPCEYTYFGKLVEKSGDSKDGFIERLWAMRRIGEILDAIDLKGKNQELIDELVKLSTKHGILTPYTSFLADENSVLTARNRNASVASENLAELETVSGSSGIAQRGFKSEMQNTNQVASGLGAPGMFNADLSVPAMNSGMARGGMGGGMMGGGGGRTKRSDGHFLTGRPGIVGQGGAVADEAAADSKAADLFESVAQNAVQNVNNRAFFQKGETWIDSTLTEAQQEPKNIITVKQFSEEYFDLINKNGKELSQYLVFDEPVLLNFNGQAYRFEP
ncbi:MAG: vWA domain-containing protein, partial [Thermoguttaceae bacterium]